MLTPITKRIFFALNRRGFFHILPDKTYVKLCFFVQMGRKLDLKNPKTFNEKLQWIKLYDRDPKYTLMVDKLLVRDYIAEKLGEEYLIPLLGTWDDPKKIDFESLPDKFVLKCNHNSGLGMCICKDKKSLDVEKVREELLKGIRQNYYLTGREWPYKSVPRRIVCEQYMEDSKLAELRDYKFFCFNGKVKCFKIDYDRFKNHRANYYSSEGELLPFGEEVCPPDFDRQIVMPKNLKKMIQLAEKLSSDCPFLRVDFYEIDGKIYFGELTFYPASGFGPFIPEEWDLTLGEYIKLPFEK